MDGARNLAADRLNGHRHAGHAEHLFKAGNCIARCVGVNGRHGAFMAGIHGLKHVEGFLAANLAEDDPVGAHAQGVLDEIALLDFTGALVVGRACFHAANMGNMQAPVRRHPRW